MEVSVAFWSGEVDVSWSNCSIKTWSYVLSRLKGRGLLSCFYIESERWKERTKAKYRCHWAFHLIYSLRGLQAP